MSYLISPRAQCDLDEIWDYTAEHWNLVQAETYLRGIWSAIKTIAVDPELGRAADDVRSGYRRYLVGSHIIFYKLTDDLVDVIRVLHSHMDFDSHL